MGRPNNFYTNYLHQKEPSTVRHVWQICTNKKLHLPRSHFPNLSASQTPQRPATRPEVKIPARLHPPQSRLGAIQSLPLPAKPRNDSERTPQTSILQRYCRYQSDSQHCSFFHIFADQLQQLTSAVQDRFGPFCDLTDGSIPHDC
jgi:hypothetical protein